MRQKPIFLLQNNYFDQIGRLIQPCLDFCYRHGHSFLDRSLVDAFDPDKLGINCDTVPGVVIYGSVGWVKRCATSTLAPWAFYDSQRFAATSWAPVFGDDALNGDGEVQTVSEAIVRLDRGERFHIRPNRDDKAFNGAVYDSDSWSAMLNDRRKARQSLPDAMLECWASPVKDILAEYRCWFVDHELIDISMYRNDGELSLKRETFGPVPKAAVDLAARHLPMGTIVMDIARTKSGYKVIEFNPINSSGWYAASTEKILTKWCEALVAKAAI
jgi:hypothetical protein